MKADAVRRQKFVEALWEAELMDDVDYNQRKGITYSDSLTKKIEEYHRLSLTQQKNTGRLENDITGGKSLV